MNLLIGVFIIRSIHLAIAIPTFNRLEYIKNLLSNLRSQHIPKNVKLSIIVSNIASRDGTSEFLEKSKIEMSNLIIYNKAEDNEIYSNNQFLVKSIPEDVDWVWWMGDDDYLVTSQAIKIVTDIMFSPEHMDVFFIHACQKRRCANTNKIIKDDLLNLCNNFGYLEILGWMSSLILKKEVFIAAIYDSCIGYANIYQTHKEGYQVKSCFPHSRSILEHCYLKKAIFLDIPLAEPVDNEQTEKCKIQWASTNHGERYVFILDDLAVMKKNKTIPDSLSGLFFRYHQYFLWDRWIGFQLELLLKFAKHKGKLVPKHLKDYQANWRRIISLPDFIDDPVLKKYLTILIGNCWDLAENFIENKLESEDQKKQILRQMQLLSAPVFEFSIIQ